LNYVILEKAKPYTRTRKGKLERVKGYVSQQGKTEKIGTAELADDISEYHDIRALNLKSGGYDGWMHELKNFVSAKDSAVFAMKGLVSNHLANDYKIYPKSGDVKERDRVKKIKYAVTFNVIKVSVFKELDEQVSNHHLDKESAKEMKEDFSNLLDEAKKKVKE
jgi:hypothetical protein